MAVTARIFPLGLVAAYDGDVSVGDHIIKCALLSSSYSPSQQTNQNWLQIKGPEISGQGYTAGGVALSGISLSVLAGATFRFWASECSWANSTISARYAVIYDSTSGYLLSYMDFGQDETSFNGLFKIDFNDTEGIFQINT